MAKKLIFSTDATEYPVAIYQDSTDRLFTVTYGLERQDNLSYDEAAKHLGQSLMHSATCQGLVEIEETIDADEKPFCHNCKTDKHMIHISGPWYNCGHCGCHNN